jgi:uncharacterized protein (TIGR02391 family)
MSSMKAGELLSRIDEFRDRLVKHKQLWMQSREMRGQTEYAKARAVLEEQSGWLTRNLGVLRSYIVRFDRQWTMVHPATGVRWDALASATGLRDDAIIKAPSLSTVIEKLNVIAGKLETLDPDDRVPADPTEPMRAGQTADRLMHGYLPHLHPFIAAAAEKLYVDGHFSQAVEESAKAVFGYIRDATGLTQDGATLAQQAFSLKGGPLAFSDLGDDTKRNEQLGFMEMLAAFAKGVRNPLAHTHGKLEEAQKAFEYVVMASLFCRRVDDAKPKTSGA